MNEQPRTKNDVLRNDRFEIAAYILRILHAENEDVRPLLASAQAGSLAKFLSEGPHGDAQTLRRISLAAMSELSRIALQRDGRPNARQGDWELLVYCLVSCRSLRSAIERMIEFFRAIDGRLGFASLSVDGAVAELRFDCLHLHRSLLSLALDLIGMASMHGLLSWLIAEPIPVQEIILPYPASFGTYCDQRILPYPIKLEQAGTAIRFPVTLLDHPLVRSGADCEGHEFEFFLEARDEGWKRSIVEQARQIMYVEMRDEWDLLSLGELSLRLNRNSDTLRRQLKEAGSSYTQIKDSCRCELGLHLLRRTDLKIEEIAARLDFCDSDAFRRAFHQWTGISPSSYRRGSSAVKLLEQPLNDQ